MASDGGMNILKMFQPGGIFGGPDTSAIDAQNQFLQTIMGQSLPLYQQLKLALKGEQGLEDQAFNAETGAYDSAYQPASDSLNTGALPQATLDWLNQLRQSRLGDVSQATNTAMGNATEDLAKRGVQSSSSAESDYGNVASQFQPAINSIEADYANSLKTLPLQNAQNIWNLGSQYGTQAGQAYKAARSDVISPYLSMWGASAATAAKPPSQGQPNSQGASALGTILSAIA